MRWKHWIVIGALLTAIGWYVESHVQELVHTLLDESQASSLRAANETGNNAYIADVLQRSAHERETYPENLKVAGYIGILGGVGCLIVGFYRHPSKG